MALRVVRSCARCGRVETRGTPLITLGELVGAAPPLDLQDADPVLWTDAYCRARDCAGRALSIHGAARLRAVRAHNRGVVR